MMSKCYSELMTIKSFEDRFEYLRLDGRVCEETFGQNRYINQVLYNSRRWRSFRNKIILRDKGCDLAFPGHEIAGPYESIYRINKIAVSYALVHHINPITLDDILEDRFCVFDPENVILTTRVTHNAIHYGDENQILKDPIERRPNDTCPWKH